MTVAGLRARRAAPFALAIVLAGVASGVAPAPAAALVHYDSGRREVGGVLLLADADDPTVYYYLPPAPRLATKPDGTFELLCLKYVDPAGETSGGLFHALVELTLPPEEVAALEKALAKEVPGARLAGALPLVPSDGGDEEGGGSFSLVSAVLADGGEGGFTRSVVASSAAPVTPGSRAVVAAVLDPRGATLLWDSLAGPTSDVSVEIRASYEARVESYRARVTAEVETVYRHLSEVRNIQKRYEKRQIRDAVDELIQSGGIEVEVTDRSAGTGGGDLEGLLDIVTQKLTETFFDHQSGWSREPPREAIVESGQLRGRQQRGILARIFAGSGNSRYYTDDQWVLKDREDIRRQRFVLDLSRRSTVRVPVATAGNLGGLYDALRDDPRYFRVVSFDDPDFELRPIHLQVDSSYLEAFGDVLNLVSVDLRKTLPTGEPWSRTLTFGADELAEGGTVQQVNLPRLGAADPGWADYDMRVRWSLRGGGVVSDPAGGRGFRSTSAAVHALAPPLDRRDVEIDLDAEAADLAGVASAVVEFATFLGGDADFRRRIVLRPSDAEPSVTTTLFADRGRPIAYRVSWHGSGVSRRGELEELGSEYLYLVPPNDFGWEEP